MCKKRSRYLTMDDGPLPALRPAPPLPSIDRELQSAARYAASALAPSTRLAYERDWLVFATWGSDHKSAKSNVTDAESWRHH
jgi:hypothetical protein